MLALVFLSLSIGLFGQIDQIVSSLSQNGTLSFDQDTQHANFQKLVTIASLEELIELTEHDSPAVRGYAFWGLAKKNYEELESIFINHLDDRAKVVSRNGCLVGDNTVIEFMRQVVTPYLYDQDCKKLSAEVRAMVQ